MIMSQATFTLGHRLKAEVSTSGCLIQHVPIVQSSITYICMQVLLDLLERSEVTLYTWVTSLQRKLYKPILI